MKNRIDTPEVDRFYEAVLNLKNKEECRAFFKDLCTVNELVTISQRFDVGIRLMQGMTYQEVSRTTGASTATISRVNRALNYGTDGYDLVLKRMHK